MLPFQFVQNAILEGSGAVRRNAGLIRKVYMPMEVLVIAGVTVKLIEFLLQHEQNRDYSSSCGVRR